MIDPFAYSTTPHARQHAPAGYKNYAELKPWLRDEFAFRCVYCLRRERWCSDRQAIFGVDHLLPLSVAPQLACVYENLLYACNRCNSLRQITPTLNPCREAMNSHVRVESNGFVVGLTGAGVGFIDLLWLNEEPLVEERLRLMQLREQFRHAPDDPGILRDLCAWFGYPEDLPDLRTLRPPGGNALAVNAADCSFARRERGELPEVY